MVLLTRESRKPPPYRDSDSYSPGLFFYGILFTAVTKINVFLTNWYLIENINIDVFD